MAEVARHDVRSVPERDDLPGGDRGRGRAVGVPAKSPEHFVESPVLFDDENDVLDSRVEIERLGAGGPRRSYLAGRVAFGPDGVLSSPAPRIQTESNPNEDQRQDRTEISLIHGIPQAVALLGRSSAGLASTS